MRRNDSEDGNSNYGGGAERRGKRTQCRIQIAAPPAKPRPERHEDQQRDKYRRKRDREVRCTDGYFLSRQRIESQGIQRAEKHDRGGNRQQQIVQEQRRLPADRLKRAAFADLRRAPSKKRQRPADGKRQHDENEEPAFGIIGKRMHRGEDARAHKERSNQAQRESQDRQKQSPGAERPGAF